MPTIKKNANAGRLGDADSSGGQRSITGARYLGVQFAVAKSLITHPKARMTKTPMTKMSNNRQPGQPPAASHNAHSVGHKSNIAPIGRSKRLSFIYSAKRDFIDKTQAPQVV